MGSGGGGGGDTLAANPPVPPSLSGLRSIPGPAPSRSVPEKHAGHREIREGAQPFPDQPQPFLGHGGPGFAHPGSAAQGRARRGEAGEGGRLQAGGGKGRTERRYRGG